MDAFEHETKIKMNLSRSEDSAIERAIAKNWGDFDKKRKRNSYYQAHAEMYMREMNKIFDPKYRDFVETVSTTNFRNVMLFVEKVLRDHLALFEDWGRYKAEVPMVFGSVRNPLSHPMHYFQGAKQAIYGHGSFGLSFVENHSELAVATIRQAVEVRLRNAFGLIGKVRQSDGAFHPVALSVLLDVLTDHKDGIDTAIPLHNLVRVNGWANISLHHGFRDYAWTAPRVVDYLCDFLIGRPADTKGFSVNSGIKLSKEEFCNIRSELREKIEGSDEDELEGKFVAEFRDVENCEVVFTDSEGTLREPDPT